MSNSPSPNASPSSEGDIPTSFLCPITGEMMSEPVMTVTSQTYERKAIEKWFSEVMARCGSFRDPVTNLPLPSRDLKPNYALKGAIAEYAEKRRRAMSLRDKSRNEVGKWLKDLNLFQYMNAFAREGFDRLEALSHLRQEDLATMGVKRGHAKIILNNLPRASRPPPISAKQVKRRMRIKYRTPSKSPRTESSTSASQTTPPRVRGGDQKHTSQSMDEVKEMEVAQEFEQGSDKASAWGKAYPHYVKAMKLGNPLAFLKVGLCHLFGMHATRIDYRKGALFVKEAVRRGVKEAELWLGYCYGFGKGLPRDQRAAINLLLPDQKSSLFLERNQELKSIGECGEIGDIGDGLPYGILAEGTLQGVKNPGEPASSEPSSVASTTKEVKVPLLSTTEAMGMLFAAICYHRGGYGLEKDTGKAKGLYQRSIPGLLAAASKGNPYAQNSLGVCYQYGTGVPQNYCKAVEFYASAGVFGHADAQYSLGVSYHDGKGLHKNEEKAVVMYSAAARQGHPTAQAILGWCFVQRIASNSPRTGREVRGRKEECKKALELWSASAENGNCALAQYSLGLCYETGRAGVNVDQDLALEWYKKASEQDFQRAQVKLKELEVGESSPVSIAFDP